MTKNALRKKLILLYSISLIVISIMPSIQQEQKRIVSKHFVYELKMLDPTYSHVEDHKWFENRKSLMHYLNSDRNIKISLATVFRMCQSSVGDQPRKRYP